MSVDIDRDDFRTEFHAEGEAFLAEQNAIEDALDDDRDPFAGEDPPDDYLEAEAERQMLWHEQQFHEGSACDCPTDGVPVSGKAPF